MEVVTGFAVAVAVEALCVFHISVCASELLLAAMLMFAFGEEGIRFFATLVGNSALVHSRPIWGLLVPVPSVVTAQQQLRQTTIVAVVAAVKVVEPVAVSRSEHFCRGD